MNKARQTMKICHVIESAATGSASVMLTLAELGIANGHDVTVVYSPVRASDQFMARACSIPGLRLITLTMYRAPGPHDLKACLGLRRILKDGAFDAVHSHSSKAGAIARLAGIGLRSKQIYAPHGFVTMGGAGSRVFGWIERILAPLGDVIIAVSQKEKEHGVSIGIAEKRISVVPNGIVEDAIKVPAKRPKSQPFTAGFVGRLSFQKDPILGLEAFRHLVDAHPDSRLIMIGHGEYEDDVREKIAALGLTGKVELRGACAALPFFPNFDVLLCSSRFEGMSLTFLEALAHGVPIVSTDVGGVDELIDDGKTGYVCAATAQELAEKLITLAMMNDDARDVIRNHAIARARAYTVVAMYDRTMQLYARVSRDWANI